MVSCGPGGLFNRMPVENTIANSMKGVVSR